VINKDFVLTNLYPVFSQFAQAFFNSMLAISLACISSLLGFSYKFSKNIPNSSRVISENLNSYASIQI